MLTVAAPPNNFNGRKTLDMHDTLKKKIIIICIWVMVAIGSTYPKANILAILAHIATRMPFHATFRTS
jgi:hypothetical protein